MPNDGMGAHALAEQQGVAGVKRIVGGNIVAA